MPVTICSEPRRRGAITLGGIAALFAILATPCFFAQAALAQGGTPPATEAALAQGGTPPAAEMVLTLPAPPPDNAYPEFVRIAAAAHNAIMLCPISHPVETVETASFAAYRAAALELEPIMDQLRPALNRPIAMPHSSDPQQLSFNTTGGSFRGLERAILGACRYYYLNGEYGRSAQTIMDGAEAGAMMGTQGPLDVVSIACEALPLSWYERVLPRLTAPELAAAAARLDRIETKQVSYADALRIQKIIMLRLIQALNRDPKFNTLEYVHSLIDEKSDAPPSKRAIREFKRYQSADKNGILWDSARYFDALIAEAQQPWRGDSKVTPPDNVFAITLLDISPWVRRHWVQRDTTLALLKTETALYRFRADKGALPAKLEDLAPTYLNHVPQDPCNETRTLTYRLQKAAPGYILYSVGLNRKDDGGKADFPPHWWRKPARDMVAGRLYNHALLPTYSYKDGSVPDADTAYAR